MTKGTLLGWITVLATALVTACFNPAGGGTDTEDTDDDPRAFISTWQTDASGDDTISSTNQIKLPLESDGTYNFAVDWGDGTTDTITSADQVLPGESDPVTHTYAAPGTYDVTITGTINGFGFGWDVGSDNTDADKLIDVKEWGPVVFRNDGGVFMDADNLSGFSATDSPELSSVTSIYSMFRFANTFNGNIGGWDTSAVTNMSDVFRDTPAFNGDIGAWDTSSVRNMRLMFDDAAVFNQDIGQWDTSGVNDMGGMFQNAVAFNQDIGGWDTSEVRRMFSMFFNAESFNQDIGRWVTSSVNTMRYMFQQARAFNQDIGGWDTSGVTEMQGMFYNADAFDQDIGGWVTSSVTKMEYMFGSANQFDQNLSGWCVSLIASEPTSFDENATGWTLPNSRPVWGTCPE